MSPVCIFLMTIYVFTIVQKQIGDIPVHVSVSEWMKFVKRKSTKWRNHIYRWLTNFNGSKHVVFYERLKTNLHQELINLSFFLGVNATLLDIWCAVKEQEGLYHRVKPDWFVPSSFYTDEQNFIVQSKIDNLYSLMKQYYVLSEIRLNFDKLYREGNNHEGI